MSHQYLLVPYLLQGDAIHKDVSNKNQSVYGHDESDPDHLNGLRVRLTIDDISSHSEWYSFRSSKGLVHQYKLGRIWIEEQLNILG